MLNSNKYIYHIGKHKGKKTKLFVAAIVIVLVLGIVVFFSFTNKSGASVPGNKIQKDINDLWNSKKYENIIVLAEQRLELEPLDHFYLTFRGISYFYEAKSEPEKKEIYLNKAIFSLRKALLVSKDKYAGEINYILGLSYFLKGKYFYDYAIKFMEASLASGYKGVDTYKCLGLSYGGLELPDKELEYFLEALKEEESSASLLAVGDAYMKKNQYDKAEEYLIRALNNTQDVDIIQDSRTRLGDIYMEKKDLLKAEEQYDEIIKINPKSANAYFNLGEIYFQLNDTVKARSYWRETLKIDPSHYGAKVRYYK
jgi:tetratricopeptide (TPR) repeat protein